MAIFLLSLAASSRPLSPPASLLISERSLRPANSALIAFSPDVRLLVHFFRAPPLPRNQFDGDNGSDALVPALQFRSSRETSINTG
jgi:hypothetical protein